MTLENKLGINDALELAHEEERLTKKCAFELFDKNILDSFEVVTLAGLMEYCAVGVAMGNGGEEIKAKADFVTDAVADDGLAHAFQRLGLI